MKLSFVYMAVCTGLKNKMDVSLWVSRKKIKFEGPRSS